jgi:hypothetical protein
LRVTYLTTIIVIENKMHLVKRMFAKLVLNAAPERQICPSAGPPERRCRSVVYPLSGFLPSTSLEHGRVALASADDAGLTQPAYIAGIETELRLEDRLAVFS